MKLPKWLTYTHVLYMLMVVTMKIGGVLVNRWYLETPIKILFLPFGNLGILLLFLFFPMVLQSKPSFKPARGGLIYGVPFLLLTYLIAFDQGFYSLLGIPGYNWHWYSLCAYITVFYGMLLMTRNMSLGHSLFFSFASVFFVGGAYEIPLRINALVNGVNVFRDISLIDMQQLLCGSLFPLYGLVHGWRNNPIFWVFLFTSLCLLIIPITMYVPQSFHFVSRLMWGSTLISFMYCYKGKNLN